MRHGSSGVTMLELIVVMGLLALAVGIGASYLGPLEQPVETAGELFEGLLKQTRAKAMATTSVPRFLARPHAGKRVTDDASRARSTNGFRSFRRHVRDDAEEAAGAKKRR